MILPDLQELLGMRAAAQGLNLQARRRARTLQSGGHQSAHRGRGLEFEEVRPYVSGDDSRSIDWRVTARRGRPHTKLFREERERPVWLLADLHPAMFFATRRQLKSAVVVRAAALLAWTAALRGDRVGAVIVGSSACRVIPPRSREAAVLPLLGALLEAQPTHPGPDAPESLAAGLRALMPVVHPGSLILALSDFANLNPFVETHWPALAAHNECQLFWVTDPLEEQGLPDGRFRVGLADRSVSVDGQKIRSAWLAKWTERQSRISALSRRSAGPVIRLDTREAVEDVLRPLLLSRGMAA